MFDSGRSALDQIPTLAWSVCLRDSGVFQFDSPAPGVFVTQSALTVKVSEQTGRLPRVCRAAGAGPWPGTLSAIRMLIKQVHAFEFVLLLANFKSSTCLLFAVCGFENGWHLGPVATETSDDACSNSAGPGLPFDNRFKMFQGIHHDHNFCRAQRGHRCLLTLACKTTQKTSP